MKILNVRLSSFNNVLIVRRISSCRWELTWGNYKENYGEIDGAQGWKWRIAIKWNVAATDHWKRAAIESIFDVLYTNIQTSDYWLESISSTTFTRRNVQKPKGMETISVDLVQQHLNSIRRNCTSRSQSCRSQSQDDYSYVTLLADLHM